jgi:hypothetical protein
VPPDAAGESVEQLARRLALLRALDEVRRARVTRLKAAALVGLGLDEFLH